MPDSTYRFSTTCERCKRAIRYRTKRPRWCRHCSLIVDRERSTNIRAARKLLTGRTYVPAPAASRLRFVIPEDEAAGEPEAGNGRKLRGAGQGTGSPVAPKGADPC